MSSKEFADGNYRKYYCCKLRTFARTHSHKCINFTYHSVRVCVCLRVSSRIRTFDDVSLDNNVYGRGTHTQISSAYRCIWGGLRVPRDLSPRCRGIHAATHSHVRNEFLVIQTVSTVRTMCQRVDGAKLLVTSRTRCIYQINDVVFEI